MLLKRMLKKFEINQTKIKGSCQSYTKAAPQKSWSDLTLAREREFGLPNHAEKMSQNPTVHSTSARDLEHVELGRE